MGLKNKKKIIAIILIVVIVIISGITYGYWNKEYIGKENTNNFNCLQIEVKENKEGISLNNTYPITDEEGINDKNNMYEVQIKNTCNLMVQYNVIANVINSSNLEESHVKIGSKKTSEEEYAINLLSNYEETTPRVEEVKKARVIKRGYLKGNETTKISVKEWMDYETTKEEGENKKFISKITIEAINGENTLGGKILANNEVRNEKIENLDFSVGFPNANTSEEETERLSGLYRTEDDEGESYYFRGAVEKNYVKFADMVWRIVRINGDGTIRLILVNNDWNINSIGRYNYNNYKPNNTHAGKYTGYTYDNKNSCTKNNPCEVTYNNGEFSNEKFGGTNSDIKITLETWYKDKLNNYDDKIATSYFCNDSSYGVGDENAIPVEQALFYGSYKRIMIDYAPSLKCPNPTKQDGSLRDYGGVYKTKIGILNVDEMNTGGLSPSRENSTKSNYLYNSGVWWSMSPYVANSWAGMFQASSNRLAYYNNTYNENEIIPVINLKDNVQVTGEGTSSNPYVIK